MDTLTFILRAVELIPKFLPPSRPPEINYLSLIDKVPKYGESSVFSHLPSSQSALVASQSQGAIAPTIRGLEASVSVIKPKRVVDATGVTVSKEPRDVATACLSCTRAHLNTVAGLLNESLRFARSDGMESPEVQYRLNKAEQEMNVMERIDLAPEKLSDLSPQEQDIVREYLPKIRSVRQAISEIYDIDSMEKSAADTSILTQELRLRHLQSRGTDLNPVVELARRVKNGELTIEEAKIKLRSMLPEEE